MVISLHTQGEMQDIKLKLNLNGDKYVLPLDYLGTLLENITATTGNLGWNHSSKKYIQASIAMVEETLSKKCS